MGCFYSPSQQRYTPPSVAIFHNIISNWQPDSRAENLADWTRRIEQERESIQKQEENTQQKTVTTSKKEVRKNKQEVKGQDAQECRKKQPERGAGRDERSRRELQARSKRRLRKRRDRQPPAPAGAPSSAG